MAEDMKKLLTDRFTKAVQKSFSPCPLIGPRWFRYRGDGRPRCFQFTGASKLTKATGFKLESVVQRIVEHLDVKDLDVAVEVADDGTNNVKLNEKPGASPT